MTEYQKLLQKRDRYRNLVRQYRNRMWKGLYFIPKPLDWACFVFYSQALIVVECRLARLEHYGF